MSIKHESNPLLDDWSTEPFGMPPFCRILPAHFKPALETAFAERLVELGAIASQPADEATFDSVVVPLDRSGEKYTRIVKVFSNLCGSHAPAELQAVELEMSGPLASHENAVYTFPGLFARIDSLYTRREKLGLSPVELRLLERFHLDFVRAGARFDVDAQKRYGAITEQLATLETQFTQNVLADEAEFIIVLNEQDLAGCPDDLVAAAKQAAAERSRSASEYVITLSRSLAVPFLTYSTRRDLRQRVFTAWTARGELSPSRDNRPIILEILRLRAEQAAMHGYANYAEYATADTMAGHPDAVKQLLHRVWTPAVASARRECEQLQAFAAATERASGGGGEESIDSVQPWDWRFLAERVRAEKYDFDEASLKPYLSLECVTAAVFDCANRLYGLRFVARPDLSSYHPDVQCYEVRETSADGADRLVAIFMADNYARPNKRGGAWMSDLRNQSRNAVCADGKVDATDSERVVPIILNNNNFSRPAPGFPCLLSFDDGVTLFHEFGHGLHGMLSDVKFNRLAGTNVLSDFVELPSQLMEHCAFTSGPD